MMGASRYQILKDVIVREAVLSLVQSTTILAITIIGYTLAMAGAVGGGGLGALAINQGYYRTQIDVLTLPSSSLPSSALFSLLATESVTPSIIAKLPIIADSQPIRLTSSTHFSHEASPFIHARTSSSCWHCVNQLFGEATPAQAKDTNMKRFRSLAALAAISALALSACGNSDSGSDASADPSAAGSGGVTKIVGASPVPHADILNFISLRILPPTPVSRSKSRSTTITFYRNEDLQAGDLDANYFATIPYYDEQVEMKNFNFDRGEGVHIEPTVTTQQNPRSQGLPRWRQDRDLQRSINQGPRSPAPRGQRPFHIEGCSCSDRL